MIMHSASVCLFTQMACVQFSTTGAKGWDGFSGLRDRERKFRNTFMNFHRLPSGSGFLCFSGSGKF